MRHFVVCDHRINSIKVSLILFVNFFLSAFLLVLTLQRPFSSWFLLLCERFNPLKSIRQSYSLTFPLLGCPSYFSVSNSIIFSPLQLNHFSHHYHYISSFTIFVHHLLSQSFARSADELLSANEDHTKWEDFQWRDSLSDMVKGGMILLKCLTEVR